MAKEGEYIPRKKTGGRKKGTPNKDKQALLDQVREAVGDPNYHPVVEMAKVAHMDVSHITDPVELAQANHLKMLANKEVAPYLAPKLKSVEITNEDDQGFGVLVLPAILSEEEFLKRATVVKELHAN